MVAIALNEHRPSPRPAVRLQSAHVINLRRRPDRWDRVSQHLTHDLGWNLPVVRQEAVDTHGWTAGGASTYYNAFDPYVAPECMEPIVRGTRLHPADLTRGAVGCTLSHLRLWSMLLAHESWDSMLIFEDDVRWVHPARLTVAEVSDRINNLPRDWDIVFLGAYPKEILFEGPDYQRVGFFHCTHAYVVHRSGLLRLMRGLMPLRKQLDSALSGKVEADRLRLYCLKERLFDQTWADTDIQSPMVGPLTRDY